ncbi:phenylalanine--tRNA ligase beta subunit-related protein [Streptomyces sp. WMMC500]|uniref:B3/B4 domain-containing protein n=1 Tax=Streptomyces sp. WMMC500 TaxID=3015154 RepID=UPI00248C197D|nr:phenylalanine--tRNA ligase beta subunit-related protein [Streptomyces sp. WMMC500]WBB58001.1 phenylalanine--tRNA ligase beta subunit-related protein [Streptomyces sp. WMMC500]
MRFGHAAELRAEFPELVAGVLYGDFGGGGAGGPGGPGGPGGGAELEARIAAYTDVARRRLAEGTEGEFPEVRAWRRTYTRLGLRPTQYRCASESLLRRLRREGSLPRIHPVVDLCNAVSVAYAIPVAVLDVDRVAEPWLQVRRARGDETYTAFGGGDERPAAGEVTFADSSGRAHARRWTNRQSGYSAVGAETRRVLVVAEGVHETAAADVAELTGAVEGELERLWGVAPKAALLTEAGPEFVFAE